MRNTGWRRSGGPQGGSGPGPLEDLDRPDGLDPLAGMAVAERGGEAGLLEAVLALAERQLAAGRAPFAALVVRGGEVAGAGVNTVEEDLNPSVHAAGIEEVVFAAPKELIASDLGPVPDDVVRLILAGASMLPGQARRGVGPVPGARLAWLFTVVVANGCGR